MNSRGDVNFQDILILFVIYVLTLSIVSSVANVTLLDNPEIKPVGEENTIDLADESNNIVLNEDVSDQLDLSENDSENGGSEILPILENDSSGENEVEFESNQTESNQTESNQTESNQTESNQTESNQTESTQTESNQTESNQTESNQTESNQTESNQTESNQTESNQTESTQTESNQTESNQTESNIVGADENGLEGGLNSSGEDFENEFEVEIIQEQATILKEVIWKKKLYGATENVSAELPEGAIEISRKIKFDEEINSEYLEIEYETPAPDVDEKEIVGGKEVSIHSFEHYQNVLAYTDLDESLNVLNPEEVKINWIEGNREIYVKQVMDRDNNGIYDYVSWNVPHLSNQTFQIIVVYVAEHLNEQREFISNVYSEIKDYDSVFSPIINEGEFVRVKFEQELDSKRDIIVVPLVSSGNPFIEVYEKDSDIKIAEFNPLVDNVRNRVYLTGLEGFQDTFDLRVLGGSLQFDYIVDPTYGPFTFDADNDADESAWTFVSDNGADGLNPANTARAWSHDVDDTTSTDVGPTSGQGGSPDGYVYTEMSSPGAFGDTFHMTFNTILDAEDYSWVVDFYWNQRGDDNMAILEIQTNENSEGWVTRGTYAENGPDVGTGGTQSWNYESLDLTGNISDSSTELRFLVTIPSSGTTWHNDFGIDTITITGTVLNKSASIPTSLTCNGGSCSIGVNKQVELNCSGSIDPEGDNITYMINDSSGYIGNHTEGGSFIWNTTLVSEVQGANLTCAAYDFGGSNKSKGAYELTNSLIIDHSPPLIDFVSPTFLGGKVVNANFIFLNISLVESNFQNITFNLYTTHGLLSKDSFFESTSSINWTDLSDKIYFYNLTVFDVAGNSNSTLTRNITLDETIPFATLLVPPNQAHSNKHLQNLTVNITDAIGLEKAVLSIFNSSGNLINQTTINITGLISTIGILYNFVVEGVYSWFYRVFDLADNFYDTENRTLIIDTTSSSISLESISNNSADLDGDLNFNYNVTDLLSGIENCSLILNGDVVSTDFTISKNVIQSINWNGLLVGRYNFTISCFDESTNVGESELRFFDVISINDFSGDTTNLANEDLSNLIDFTLHDLENGKIKYNEVLDLRGVGDFDSLVSIDKGAVFVNSTRAPSLNASATIEMYNLSYAFEPIVLKDGAICSDCKINSYSGGNLSFNVTSFSEYTLNNNSKLEIFDETEYSDIHMLEEIVFYANYTNRSSFLPISAGSCNISFEDSNVSMTYNSSSELYEYSRNFSTHGPQDYVVTCFGFDLGYENISLKNTAIINFHSHEDSYSLGYLTQSGVYNFVGTDEFIPLDFEVNSLNTSFVIAPNKMNQENTTAGTSGDPATRSDDSFVSLYLYNTTHIRAQRTASDDGPVVVTWQVLEAKGNEFSVQRGAHEFSGSSTKTSVTIPSSVNVSNSLSWFYINTSYTSNNGDVIQFYSNLSNSTNLDFIRENSSTSTDVSFRWVIVEWDLDKIDSFSKGYTGEITGPDTSPDCFSIGTTINKSSSFLFHQSHAISDSDGGLDSSVRAGYIRDDNTVCFYDYDGVYTAGVKWYVVDFGNTTGREEDTHTDWASEDYSDDVIFSNSFLKNQSLFFVTGTCNGDGTAKPRQTEWSEFNSSQNNVTGLHIERTYGGQKREYAWEVLGFSFYENLDSPQFFNYSVNDTYISDEKLVRFSLIVNDSSENISFVTGRGGGGIEEIFTKGEGDLWYYDYSCVEDGLVEFEYVFAGDEGIVSRTNSTIIHDINVTCDSTAPSVSFLMPNTPIDGAHISKNYLNLDVDIEELNFYQVIYDLYNSTHLINQTIYNSSVDSIRFSNISSGTYYYNVTVIDLAGNKAHTETRSAIFDVEAPSIAYTLGTEVSGNFVSQDFIFVNVTVDEANFENITFYLYDESMAEERTPVTYSSSNRFVNWTLLADGIYYYKVDSYDSFGNYNATELRNITLDTTFPEIFFTQNTKPNNSYYDREFIFAEVNITDINFEKVTFELYNGSNFLLDNTTYFDNTRSITWDFLSQGIYYYNVSVWDRADNLVVTETRKMTLDLTNPLVSFGTGVELAGAVVNNNFIYINSSVDELNFKNITFLVYEDDVLLDTKTFSNLTTHYNFSDFSSGTYEYKILVYDLAENFGQTLLREISLDLDGPVVDIVTPKPIAYGAKSDLELNYTVADSLSSIDSCWWNIDGGSNATVICGENTTFDTDDGTHTIYFYSNDSFGNQGSDAVTFFISTGGPAIILHNPINDTFYSEETEVFFNYSAIDSHGVSSCSLYGSWNGGWHLNQTDYDWDFGVPRDENEDFEVSSWENWTEVGDSSGCVWTRGTSTPSSSTGPTGGYGPTPSGSSNFLFTEASANQSCDFNDGNHWTSLESDIFDADTYNVTLTFWYHMYGAAMGDLYLDINESGSWTNDIWNLTGGQQTAESEDWRKAEINFGNYTGQINVRLRAVVGTDYTSDISIDEINLDYAPRIVKETSNFSLNLSEEGNYDWNIRCNCSLGLEQMAMNNFTIAIDKTFPLVDFGQGTLANGSSVGVDYVYVNTSVIESNIENITFFIYSAEGLVQNYTYFNSTFNHTFSDLEDGIYKYNFTVYDKASRQNSSSTRFIELDTTNPSGELISPLDDTFTKNSTWNFTAIVNDSVGLKNATLFIYNSTDGLVYSNFVELIGLRGANIGIVYTFLYDDVFSWFYSVEDSVGNKYNITSYELEVDSTSPQITFISPTEEDGSIVLRDWIFLNTSIYEKNYQNITFNLYDSNGLLFSNSFSNSKRDINWTLLPDDVYYYNVSSFDLAGNEGYSETRQIILDDVAPIVTFEVGTEENDSVISGDSIFLNVSVIEENEKNISFILYDDVGTIVRENDFLDSRRSVTWDLLSSGIYYYNVTVYDEVNLKGFTETRKITLDNTNPIVSFDIGTENNNANKSQDWIYVNASIIEDNFRDVVFELYNQSGLVERNNFTDGTMEINWTNLEDGSYTYNFTAYDLTDNAGTSSIRKIILDTISPLVTFVSPTENNLTIFNRDWVYLNTTIVENNFKEIKFRLYDSEGIYEEQSFTNHTWEYNFTSLPDDNYYYEVIVYDFALNEGNSEIRYIGLDSEGPVVEILKPKSKTYGTNESLELEHSVSDKVSSLDSCWWNIDGGANQSINCNNATTFNTTVDTHTINFYANDTFGNLGQDTVTFFISITGPAMELVRPENNTFYSQATNINFSFSASDPDGVDSCSLYGDWGLGWSEKEKYNGDWYDIGFQHRKNITITNVGSTTLTNYPVYLNITNTHTCAGDYSDLILLNGSCEEGQTTLLSYEIEDYDSTNANLWVKIPNFVSGENEICLYYGNDNAENGEDVSNVWDSSYTSVYHLEHTSGTAIDTMGNFDAEDGIDPDSNMDKKGITGGADYFDGNDYLGTNPEWNVDGAHTYCTWVKFGFAHNGVILEDGGQTDGTGLGVTSAGALRYAECYDNAFNPMDSGTGYDDSEWHYLCGGHTGSSQFLYVDGELVNSIVQGDGLSGSGNARIGQSVNANPVFDNGNADSFTGYLDEIRISSVARSSDWINQSYQQIANQGEVTIFGNEENFVAFNQSISSEGEYDWNVKCNDTVGYDSFALLNFTFIVDVTNPQVLFASGTKPDLSIVGDNWIFVIVNLIENNFQNITFDLYNESLFLEDTVSFTDDTREYNFTGLSSGIYYYNVTVYDKASREGDSGTRKITLDLSAPTGSLGSPTNGSYVKDSSQNLTGTFSDSTGLLNATLYVFNQTGFLIYTSFQELLGVTSISLGIIYDFISEGIYNWFYSVEDNVGNVYDTENNTLIVDLTPPLIDYTLGTENSGLIFERENIYVNVTTSDEYFHNVTFDLYNSDGLMFRNGFTSSKRDINWTLLPDGFYEYNVTAYDLAGNSNTTQTRNLTLDNLNPTIDFGAGTQENGAFISGDTIFVNVTVEEANEKNITFYLYDENYTEIKSNTFTDGRNTISWNLLAEGIYYYNVTVFDVVNHGASTSTRYLEIDDTSPVLSYGFGTESNGETFARDWVYFKVNLIEDNFQNITLSLYNSSGLVSNQIFTGTTREYNWTDLNDGTYWYNATSRDKANNLGTLSTRTIKLDNILPSIAFTIGTEQNNFNKTSDWVFANVSFVEDNFANITFELRDSNQIINSTTFSTQVAEINWTFLDSKVYYYNVTIFDLAGNHNSTEVRKIGIDYLGPSISIINPKPKAYGYNISLPLNYNVFDQIVGNDFCWYNLDGGTNITVNCSLSSSFNTSNGEHILNFYANDTFGNLNYENVTFLVSTTGPAIQLITPEDNSFYSKPTEIFFNYTAEDPDLTESCSLYGSWNGGWHLNQTDSDWIIGERYNDSEDFELYVDFNQSLEFSNFSNSATDDCDWQTDSGGTASGSTGPTADHTYANATGTYLYLEASAEAAHTGITEYCSVTGEEANLVSQVLDADLNNYNLSFWYNMNGAAMGTLYIDVYDGSWHNGIWSISGNQGDVWTNKVVDLSEYEGDIKVRLRGARGSDYTSDLAIDDLKIISTPGGNKPYGNFSVNLSSEGENQWNIKCNDTLGYDTWAVSNYTFTFDVTNPVVDFGANTLPNDSQVSQNFIYVNSSIIENNFANVSFYLYNQTHFLLVKEFNDSTRDANFTGLVDGKYFYNITVYDSSSRFGNSSTRSILLDTKKPTGTLLAPSNNAYVNNATQNLTGTFEDENGLKEVILFIYNQTGLVYSTLFSLGNALNSVVGIVYEFLMDGIYSWFYQAEDIVGNKYNTSQYNLTVDTTLPKITFIPLTADNGTYLTQEYIYANVSVEEINFKNITFSLKNETDLIQENHFTNSKRDINWTLLSDNKYFYDVTVWDLAGNVNSSETREIILDTVFPTISYSSGTPSENSNLSQDFIFVNVSVYDSNFENITFVLYDGEGFLNETTYFSDIRSINWTSLPDEDYYFNVSVYDKASQKSFVSTRHVFLDRTIPIINFSSGTEPDAAQLEQNWVYLDVVVDEDNFKEIKYSLFDENGLVNETIYSTLIEEINFSVSSANKTYFYNVTLYDWAGNIGFTETRNISLIDVTYPQIILNSPSNITYSYNTGLRIDYSVADLNLDTCWYSLDSGENITLPNCQGVSIDVADEMTYFLEIYANDSLGYQNKSNVTFSVNSSLIDTPTYSVESGNVFLEGSEDVLIPQRDTSKSFILHTVRASDDGPDTLQVISKFINSTTISFENYDSGESAIVEWSLISGPNIHVQRGEIPYTTEKYLGLAINQVNLSNSFIIVNNKLNSTNSNENVQGFWEGFFLSEDNVSFYRSESSSSGVLSWQIVSWEGVSVQSGNLSVEDGILGTNSTFQEVNLNQSFLIFSKQINGTTSVSDSMVKGGFYNSSSIEFERTGSGGNINLSYFIVNSELFNSQRGNYVHSLVSSEQYIDLSRELINISRAFDLNSLVGSSSLTVFSQAFVTQKIYDNDSLALQKGVGSGSGSSQWFAVEIMDLNSPVINLTFPESKANFTRYNVPYFNITISDESAIKNCSLFGNWTGNWHKNQTIFEKGNFSSITVPEGGNYKWAVECFDIYGNKQFSENRTFNAYLAPNNPVFLNISQTSNDGLGNITFSWNETDDTLKYRIYSSDDFGEFSLLAEVDNLNYTDDTFAGSRRRFYKVEAWNPVGVNLSYQTIGAHIYSLKQTNIKNRNFIGMPTNFTYLQDANDSLNEINGATSFTTYNATSQRRVTCNDYSCPESFACTSTACNFKLSSGLAYEVNLNDTLPLEVNWSGVGLIYEPINLELIHNNPSVLKSENWISMYANTTLNTARDLLNSIGDLDFVARWNSELQKSEGLISIMPPFITGFNLEIEEGYSVSIRQDKNWEQE